jgi:hypothetical protein
VKSKISSIFVSQNNDKMKNIHVLPTDKPTTLFKDDFGNFIYSINIDQEQNHFEPQHLFITSDEEIKDAKWIIHNGKIHEVTKNKGLYISVKEVSHIDIRANLCKKIILTTDPDLIKDGVQAIDDEFLEWFVKNPSCEEVDVKPMLSNNGRVFYGYKIIIPKEEPKQELPYWYETQEWKDFSKLAHNNFGGKPKMETLEEAVERLFPFTKDDSENRIITIKRLFWIEGAKWQAERMYSELELFINEVKDKIDSFEYSVNQQSYISEYMTEWFEQFKKK